MNDLRYMNKRVIQITLILTLIISVIAGFLFSSNWLYVVIGIWIGAGTGLIGFRMIQSMAVSLDTDPEHSEKQGRQGYLERYGLYTLIFAAAAFLHVPVLAMLAGFMAHKISLFVYAYLEREDMHDGS